MKNLKIGNLLSALCLWSYLTILKVVNVVFCATNGGFMHPMPGTSSNTNNYYYMQKCSNSRAFYFRNNFHKCAYNNLALYENQMGSKYNYPQEHTLQNSFHEAGVMTRPAPQECNPCSISQPFNNTLHASKPVYSSRFVKNNAKPYTSITINSKQKNQYKISIKAKDIKALAAVKSREKTSQKIKRTSWVPILFSMDKNSKKYIDFINLYHAYKLDMLKDCPEHKLFSSDTTNGNFILKFYFNINIAIKKTKNVWVVLSMIKKESIEKAFWVVNFLNSYKNTIRNSIFNEDNVSYYPGLFLDLDIYLHKEFPFSNNTSIRRVSTDNVKTFLPCAVTLGDIYIKKDINLLWHLESILITRMDQTILGSSFIIKEKDIYLKRRFLLILSIPEIYEDLFYIKYEEIELLERIAKKNSFCATTKYISNLFCIIKYLYGEVHNNPNIIEESYKKISIATKESLELKTDIELYKLVYKVFAYFYKYSLYLYEANLDSSINNTHLSVESDSTYSAMKKYTKIPRNNITIYQGKGVVVVHIYRICNILFKYDNAEKNIRTLDKLKEKNLSFIYKCKDFIELSYSHHYHVQFVDNSANRVHIIHFPFFMLNNNGTIEYHYIHTIDDIVNHIRKTFNTNTRNDQPLINNVYPFKYSRKDKTWTMISMPTDSSKKRKLADSIGSEMNKTIEEMDKLGFDVVFYYIKENIKTTKFLFAQFNLISEESLNTAYKEDEDKAKKLFDGYTKNMHAPRIPLFLPKLTISAVYFGPYVLKSEKYIIDSIMGHQNLVPIEFSNWLDYMVRKEDRKHTIIELATVYKREINYYSDFYILGINSPYEDCDCYSMELKQTKLIDNSIKISWHVKKQYDLGEYTNYELNITDTYVKNSLKYREKRTGSTAVILFLNMLQRKHVSQDMLRYGICIYTRKSTGKSNIVSLLCPEMKALIAALFNKENEMHHMLSPALKRNIENLKTPQSIEEFDISDMSRIYISLKNVNYTKSKLGIHYNILNAVFNKYYY
ncbi:hypothetical protein NEIRO03_1986 [Nematocida sp. AWRm78]|nr:hypothetical protein NEIRO02_2187 [Nematocida sp. AWRm79]KAI5185314.1 hypothetical protein NEIRO03_1986 [Nematocida sp. AWRm78]